MQRIRVADVSGDENEEDDSDDDSDDSDVGSTDCEWTNNSDNGHGASDGAPSGDDEKDRLL